MDSKRTRLDKLVSHFAGGKKSDFAKLLEITKQSLNTWYNKEYLDIEKVYYSCPGVSAEWLLTGNGEMLSNQSISPRSDSIAIPYLSPEDILSGDWDNSAKKIVFQGVPRHGWSFITSYQDNDHLSGFIYQGALLFCTNVNLDRQDLEIGRLYIIQTELNMFFVQFEGQEGEGANTIYSFTTRRSSNHADMRIEIPICDIVKCAEIEDYTTNHYAECVI